MPARRPSKLRVCVVTGARSEYGLLRAVMAAIARDRRFELRIVAAAMHLVPEFGLTYREIETDGFHIDAKVEMLIAGDTPAAAAKSMGVGGIGFVDAYTAIRPDLVMLLGDRFEALAAASAALVMGIPIAHLSGGDVTEGAFDDSIRHAITKMAHLHFAASRDSAGRIVQMGEEPRRVFAVGDPGLDSLVRMKPIGRRALEHDLGFRFRTTNLLVTFHPVTRDRVPSTRQFAVVLDALAALGPEVGLIFTKPNADPEGRALASMLDSFVDGRDNARAYASLGHRRYLSVMAACDAVVGNSSSGLLEAPTLRRPAVNIGSRQQGRLRAKTVIDCAVDNAAIGRAIDAALKMKIGRVVNPYGDGNAARRIVAVLGRIGDPTRLLRKTFHDARPKHG